MKIEIKISNRNQLNEEPTPLKVDVVERRHENAIKKNLNRITLIGIKWKTKTIKFKNNNKLDGKATPIKSRWASLAPQRIKENNAIKNKNKNLKVIECCYLNFRFPGHRDTLDSGRRGAKIRNRNRDGTRGTCTRRDRGCTWKSTSLGTDIQSVANHAGTWNTAGRLPESIDTGSPKCPAARSTL